MTLLAVRPDQQGAVSLGVSTQSRPHLHTPAAWQVINPHEEPERGSSRGAGPSENRGFLSRISML